MALFASLAFAFGTAFGILCAARSQMAFVVLFVGFMVCAIVARIIQP